MRTHRCSRRSPRRLVSLVPLLAVVLIPSDSVSGQEASAESADAARQQQVMERFRTLLERSPKRGTALDRLYGYHVARGSVEELVQTYEDRTDADPQDGTAWMILGLIESKRGRDAEAAEAFRRAEEQRPDDALASYFLGQALQLSGRPDEAARAYERALQRRPEGREALRIFKSLGRLYQRAHRTEKALEVWSRLEEQFPGDRRVREEIAEILVEEGDHEQALLRFTQLAEDARRPYRRVNYTIQAAELKVRLGRQQEALEDFESLLGRLKPDSWLHRDVRGRIEDVFLRTDDYAGLTRYYENWIAEHPEDLQALSRLGHVLALQGRFPEAEARFREAIELAPSDRGLRKALIDQLVREEKYSEAVREYEKLAEVAPGNPDDIRAWGRLILRDDSLPEQERKQRAVEVWKRLLQGRSDDAVRVAQVADLVRQAGLTGEAIELYRRAVELDPESPQYREYLGEYYHSLGRKEEAVATWRGMAEGDRRTTRNLARLAEVLNRFGYRDEALDALAEACTLDPEFGDRMLYARWLRDNEQLGAALDQLDQAAKLAETFEERQSLLRERIANYRAGGTLSEKIAALRTSLESDGDSTAENWRRLALYLHADGRRDEAVAAIEEALQRDADSVAAWSAAAGIYESAGRFGEAAGANRKLARLEPRYRTEYLQQVASLELRLGRSDRALEAGRDLIAAAPGNPEHYRFFADLCFRLGEVEEGLEALRRAVRANPSDRSALLALGQGLADQFRTEQAMQIFWQVFQKAETLENRLGVVGRLTELYLRTNRFDQLITRLERRAQERGRRRDMTICLAEAYRAAGDLGSARHELESLLTAESRDVTLLEQLVKLAEREEDFAAAARYQRRIEEISPDREHRSRLAHLLMQAGEIDEAEAIWTQLVEEPGRQTVRMLRAVDRLLSHEKYETVLQLTGRLLRDEPDNWELLYREGIALSKLERADAAAERFRHLLELDIPREEHSAAVQARLQRWQQGSGSGTTASRRRRALQSRPPVRSWFSSSYSIRRAVGSEAGRRLSFSSRRRSAWTPDDFGQARMAALAWLFQRAQADGQQEEFLQDMRRRAGLSDGAPEEETASNRRAQWDWLSLQMVRRNYREMYEGARHLSRSGTPNASYAYLYFLRYRNRTASGSNNEDPAPLPDEELDHAVACYETLEEQKPEWIDPAVLNVTISELERADRGEEAERVYRLALDSANTVEKVGQLIYVAANRGDVAEVLELFDRFDRLRGGQLGQRIYGGTSTLCRLMQHCAAEGNHEDILRLYERYRLSQRRLKEAAPASWQRRQRSGSGGPLRLRIYTADGRSRRVELDYPRPNAHFDTGMIQLLYNAYALYEEADLLTDLTGHFREQSEQSGGAERLAARLALVYLHWWNDEKVRSAEHLARAVEAAPAQDKLRLELAQVRQGMGELDSALELVDSIDAFDTDLMKRRELMALELAVRLGDIERARQAAERLFGLRLETETQMKLASSMHQLGMHQRAEAVLARIRRRSGHRVETMATLMQQYRRQGKADVAVQIAHQILRKTSAQSLTSSRSGQNEAQRQQALQMLARSGDLETLIERVREQLERAPESLKLHQRLADYYKAAGEKEKAREVFERIAALRPDDAGLRYQLARQLASDGDHKAACDHYLAALRAEPGLFQRRYYDVQRTFRQADRLDDLVTLLSEIDLRQIGRYYVVTNVIQRLGDDEEGRDQAMRLLRKAWEAFPENRASLLSRVRQEELWKRPELYDYARQALLPEGESPARPSWQAIGNIYSYSSDGTVTGVLTRFLQVAEAQNKLDDFASEVETALEDSPDWTAGKGLLAVLKARNGETESAQKLLDDVLDEETLEDMPAEACWIFGQELEEAEGLQNTVLRLYQQAAEDSDRNSLGRYSYSPARRLALYCKEIGRREEARDVLLRVVEGENSSNVMYSPGHTERQQIRALATIGEELLELGYPVDAVRIYNRVLSQPDLFDSARRTGSSMVERYRKQIDEGLQKALKGLNEGTLAQTLRTLTDPQTHDGSQEEPSRTSAVDLVLLVHPPDFEQAKLISLFQSAVEAAAEKRELLEEVRSNLEGLRADHPEDVSLAVAETLVALTAGKDGRIDQTLSRLQQTVVGQELESIPPSRRANARQRAEAARWLPLWLIVRRLREREDRPELAQLFARRALQAARRQKDHKWALAMLRERGERVLDAEDRQRAERAWAEMLEIVLERPDRKTASRDSAAGSTPIATVDRFRRAVQIARLAAEHEMPGLSLRAVRQTLAGGPPIEPPSNQDSTSSRGVVYTGGLGGGSSSSRSGGDSHQQILEQVEESLFELNRLWDEHDVPAEKVYETFAAIVLPEARPGELFLYPQPLTGENLERPRSLGRLLCDWAVQAERVEALRKRIEPRREQPRAALAAEILLTQLAMHSEDYAAAQSLLEGLGKRLEKDSLQRTAELACHVAVPALSVEETSDAALPVVERAAKNLGQAVDGSETEPLQSLLLLLSRLQAERDNAEAVNGHLNHYLQLVERRYSRYSGDYALYRRKEHLQRVVEEFARAGLVEQALARLGEYQETSAGRYESRLRQGSEVLILLRQLAARPAEERYELLRDWTLPSEQGAPIRIASSYAPEDRPPKGFARCLDQPAETAFRLSAAGTRPHLASTATLLVGTARQLDRLDELAEDLGHRADEGDSHARVLRILVDVARGETEQARPRIEQLAESLRRNLPEGDDTSLVIDLGHVLVVQACLEHEPLRELGREMLQTIITYTQRNYDDATRNHLRLDRARAVLRGRPGHRSGLLRMRPLGPWRPAAHETASTHAAGALRSRWVAHEGHIQHLVGPEDDYLFLRYPLTGTFEFTADVEDGPWAEGGLGYAGLTYLPIAVRNNGTIWAAGKHGTIQKPCPFSKAAAFNRMTVQVSPGKVRYILNGHLWHEDESPGATSPWLALHATSFRDAVFRNLRFEGTPVIPEKVPLTDGDDLRGWISNFYGESQPAQVEGPPSEEENSSPPSEFDWSAEDGIIEGRRTAHAPQADPLPSRLYYHRPLFDGETVRYEFFYGPGDYAVHPALGRLAFLLAPEGVRLHWMTDGPEEDWSGLRPDNSIVEPAHRRGPKPLPLESGAWNDVALALQDGVLRLSLNGRLIYERPLDKDNTRLFGFFHYKDRSTARVRNVVLTGDWPHNLTAEALTQEVVSTDDELNAADRRALHGVIGEEMFASHADGVYRTAKDLPPEQRYERLFRWVLPNEDHPTYRLAGDFTPTHPAPPVDDSLEELKENHPDRRRVETGGEIVAPAALLVETAASLGRLDELRRRVGQSPAESDFDRRCRLALLTLIDLAEGNADQAGKRLSELKPLHEELSLDAPEYKRWPELLVAAEAVERETQLEPAKTLIQQVITQQLRPMTPEQRRDLRRGFRQSVHYVRGRAQLLTLPPRRQTPPGTDPPLTHWARVTHATAQSRGLGYPTPHWNAFGTQLRHFPGHDQDLMYFRVPLRGDFEVTAGQIRWRRAGLAYGGMEVRFIPPQKRVGVSRLGRNVRRTRLDSVPELGRDPYELRLRVRDGTLTAWIEDQRIHEQKLPESPDPWLALHRSSFAGGGVRSLEITGTPSVPRELTLSRHSDLTGWFADYYGESTGGENPDWRKEGEVIVGRHRDDLPGSNQQSVLQYHRPLLEDGAIQYEFYYEPGKSLVHPALDRLAFLLEPDGVSLHWMTDAPYDRTGLAPGNCFEEPENRLGPQPLPLKQNAWNALELSLSGKTVTLSLNGTRVYRRDLEPTNQRLFGLFHYADRTEAKVRNVTYRGDWPTELPAVEEQELAAAGE